MTTRRIVLELRLLLAARSAAQAMEMMERELEGHLMVDSEALAGLRTALKPYRETDV